MKLCFVWHQHQPDYREEGRFFLPWTRLHGTKDYADLALLIGEYPLKHTINVVPGMLSQVDDYVRGMTDPIQELSVIPHRQRTRDHQQELARWICTLQFDTMVAPLDRLKALWPTLKTIAVNPDDGCLGEQEWLDAEVLFLLAWTGQCSRKRPVASRLLEQGRNYTRQDLADLALEHQDVLASIPAILRRLENAGTIEVSVTPYYHPILPLLCDSDDARECMPHATLPSPAFTQMDDAAWHVFAGIADWHQRSGRPPRGMWPAEGSVSMKALTVMAAAGVKWTATDEAILRNSLGVRWSPERAMLPYRVNTSQGPITMVFRDHALSDAIGFTYATWDARDAVDDFLRRIHSKRLQALRALPEHLHSQIVLPIILDGENCWEFYHRNGEDFLRLLFDRIANDPELTTATVSEATANATEVLDHVVPGSWINADFGIWIGEPAKNLAWKTLREARKAVADHGNAPAVLSMVKRLEASDYFWWYDKRHVAEHSKQFDRSFRAGLEAVFAATGTEPPTNLSQSFHEAQAMDTAFKVFPVSFAEQSTMHRADVLTKEICVETDDAWQRFTVDLQQVPSFAEDVMLHLADQEGVERICRIMNQGTMLSSPYHDEGVERKSPTRVCIYLKTNAVWVASVEEQRADGTLARTALTITP